MVGCRAGAQRGQYSIVARQGGSKLHGVARIAPEHGQSFLGASDLLRRTDECGYRVSSR
jgi:hypothetical protein